MFFAANRSKRSLALDFTDERGKDALLRLIAGADVVVQSMRAGSAERHGLGSDELRARHPGSSTARSRRSARPGRSQAAPATTR